MANRQSPDRDASVIIVGSGYAAAAAVIHLAHSGFSTSKILIIGPGQLGAGQAYDCEADAFRLNVRADLQRLWPNQPDHFPQWAKTHIDDPQAKTHAGYFYRRADFARYVSAQLETASGSTNLRQVPARVVDIRPTQQGWRAICGNGTEYHSTSLLLATGNPEPQWPVANQFEDSSTLIRTPWRGDWLEQIDPTAAICLVGSWLTAMDALSGLAERDHQGPISLLSPHGILPPEQVGWEPGDPFVWPEIRRGSEFLHVALQMLKAGNWEEPDWQQRFSALRSGISKAWQQLPVEDRLKLQRRTGWLWSLARFRASPQTVRAARQMRENRQLTLIRSHLKALSSTRSNNWQLTLGNETSLHADVVINCTGVGRDPLIHQLMSTGRVAPLSKSNSLSVLPDLRVISPTGSPYDTLFCIGPASALALGDMVGATSVASQAAVLAQSLQAPA